MRNELSVAWRDVRKSFGRRAALDRFTLEAGPGIHCLLGDNGAGKSTAFAVLTGARRPDAGDVLVGGERVRRGGATARLIGSAPQSLSYPPTVRVREVVDYVAAHYAAPAPTAAILDRVGLTALARRSCGGLSGGEARRLALACALVGDTPVVVLDEPSAGLDRSGQGELREIIRGLGSAGRIVLLASHDLADVEALADRVWVVAAGRVVLGTDPDDITRRLGTRRIRFPIARAVGWKPVAVRVDPEAVVSEAAGTAIISTTRADAVARELLGVDGLADLTIERPTLGEAIDQLALATRDATDAPA
ncbi:ABC transporter ATP-binding protein [Galbitalea soli]|uniref:ABC transporter ATP-binding protein n=1 Tax=Galbitalea soli TaxID=1268042 RepID=A0A7C9PPD9_9MICO|nr:ABC transporter ATP-binding protein [Galbitalea soli]NEM92126.1 ABC transporter ATP-binding protein [Galbitalea soli]NYJ31922.1 ABC-2 type transport system ATP-binding protein [Galbitalea soli]